MNTKHYPAYDDQLKLMDAIRLSEKSVVTLRNLGQELLDPNAGEKPGIDAFPDSDELPVAVCGGGSSPLYVTLPAILPKRSDQDRSRFLAHEVRAAVHNCCDTVNAPRFRTCVIVYEFEYSSEKHHRFIDHDNMELKHIQDELESVFLVNDSSAYCSAFQCSHYGKTDCTRIWILTPEQFMEWLPFHWFAWGEKCTSPDDSTQVFGAQNTVVF